MDPQSKRRVESRMLTCIPAYIGTSEDSPHLALICDISASGARLFTRTKIEEGDKVELTLYLSREKSDCRAKGQVVRTIDRPREIASTWPYEIAVQFDELISEYAADIKELSERQQDLGLFSKKRSSRPPSQEGG